MKNDDTSPVYTSNLVNELIEKNKALEAELKQYREQYNKKNNEINEKNEEIIEAHNTIQKLGETVANKELIITQLMKKLNKATSAKEQEKTLQNLEETIQNQEDLIEELEENVESFKKTVEKKDRFIIKINQELNTRKQATERIVEKIQHAKNFKNTPHIDVENLIDSKRIDEINKKVKKISSFQKNETKDRPKNQLIAPPLEVTSKHSFIDREKLKKLNKEFDEKWKKQREEKNRPLIQKIVHFFDSKDSKKSKSIVSKDLSMHKMNPTKTQPIKK